MRGTMESHMGLGNGFCRIKLLLASKNIFFQDVSAHSTKKHYTTPLFRNFRVRLFRACFVLPHGGLLVAALIWRAPPVFVPRKP
jgi:hypothetical protein